MEAGRVRGGLDLDQWVVPTGPHGVRELLDQVHRDVYPRLDRTGLDLVDRDQGQAARKPQRLSHGKTTHDQPRRWGRGQSPTPAAQRIEEVAFAILMRPLQLPA